MTPATTAAQDPAGAPDLPETLCARVNGEVRRLRPGTTIAEIVEMLGGTGRGVAVAVGREVVPRATWLRVTVEPGADVEVVTATAGG